jgi:hypothetical protein
MARSYSVPTSCTTLAESATLPYLVILSSTTTQPGIYEVNSGASVTPANNAAQFNITKGTSIGTLGGAITPVGTNPAAGTVLSAIFTAGASASALGTYSGVMLQWAQNQNTAYRWVASSPMRMLFLLSTTNAGAAVLVPDANSTWANWIGGLHIEE